MERDKIIESYIQRLLQFQDSKDRQINEQDLAKIALDLGFGKNELKLIQAEYEARLTRGAGYSASQRWDDAINELKDALALNPVSTEAAFRLSDAFRQKWIFNGVSRDKSEAEYYAKYCLRVDPAHKPVLELLNDIEKRNISIPNLNEPNKEHNLAMIITAALILALIAAIVFSFLF